jgi:hypothetical protein
MEEITAIFHLIHDPYRLPFCRILLVTTITTSR